MTPSSKVVGDLALALVSANADPKDFEANPQNYDIPDSVIGFLGGELGDPPGGWPEPFRTKALAGRTVRPRVEELSADDEADLARDPRGTLNRLLFPGPTQDYARARELYSDLSVLSTKEFLHGLAPGQEHEVDLEPGKKILMSVASVSEPDERGMRTVLATVNGQLRPVQVRDHAVKVDVAAVEKADPKNVGHVAAPFAGMVSVSVAEGDEVAAGDTVATIEAMKMEASITTPVAGTVKRVALTHETQVEGGDLSLIHI